MYQSLDDIADLAEDIGRRFLVKGKVNLEKIAKSKGIQFIKNSYENYFVGELIHYARKFYIILNTDQLSKSENGRVRFTIAHELGHYFIDGHRSKLSKGESLSFDGSLSDKECKKIEMAANHFAAHLLMPKEYFIKKAKKFEPGFAGILVLKAQFDTSIESTTKHYVNLNLSACVMIKWRTDFTFHYAWCSGLFSTITGLNKYQLPIQFDTRYIQQQAEIIDSGNLDFIETATPLSRWFSTVMQGTSKDLLGLEQTVKLGDFGGITLLIFS